MDRIYLEATLASGRAQNCPCCGQTVKLYQRALTAVMMLQLQQLYNDEGYIHYKLLRNKIGGDADYSKMRFWGFIEPGEVGYWRITAKGRDFVEGKIDAPAKVGVFNNTQYSDSKDRISFSMASQTWFNLAELLR